MFTQDFNAETLPVLNPPFLRECVHLPVCVFALSIYSMCVYVTLISECEIRLNERKRGGGALQVLCYARFTPRYVRTIASVCVSFCGCLSVCVFLCVVGGRDCGSWLSGISPEGISAQVSVYMFVHMHVCACACVCVFVSIK